MMHDSLFPQLLFAAAAAIGAVVVIERHFLAAIRTGKLIIAEIFPSHIKKRAYAC
jgi:hypothetical protein